MVASQILNRLPVCPAPLPRRHAFVVSAAFLLPSAHFRRFPLFLGQIHGHDDEKFVQLATTDLFGFQWPEALEQGGLDE